MNQKTLRDALDYVDSVLTYKFEYLEIPSISVAVRHKGNLIYSKALGYADQEVKRKATTDTSYRVASNSKMFTAVSLLQLVEQGKLRLDDPVSMHLVWLKKHKDSRWKEVTIRQVLSHTAGIIRDSSQSGFWSLQYPFPDRKELHETVLRDKLIFEPNTTLKYSNYGFGLLGEVIELISGQSYHEYVTDHIITPLGLKHTAPDLTPDNKALLAVGYTRKTRTWKRLPIDAIDTRALSSATGFVSTPSDMTAFVSDILSENPTLIHRQSSLEMRRIHAKAKYERGIGSFYGLGLEIGETKNGSMIYGHGGGFPGQLTHTRYLPMRDICVSVVVNCLGYPPVQIVNSIFAAIAWFDSAEVKKPKHDLTRFSFRYKTLWSATDIIGYGDSLIGVYANLPIDFESAERYERVDDTTLRCVDTGSYLAPGETLVYEFDKDGTVKRVNETGTTLLPIEHGDWESNRRISLSS